MSIWWSSAMINSVCKDESSWCIDSCNFISKWSAFCLISFNTVWACSLMTFNSLGLCLFCILRSSCFCCRCCCCCCSCTCWRWSCNCSRFCWYCSCFCCCSCFIFSHCCCCCCCCICCWCCSCSCFICWRWCSCCICWCFCCRCSSFLFLNILKAFNPPNSACCSGFLFINSKVSIISWWPRILSVSATADVTYAFIWRDSSVPTGVRVRWDTSNTSCTRVRNFCCVKTVDDLLLSRVLMLRDISSSIKCCNWPFNDSIPARRNAMISKTCENICRVNVLASSCLAPTAYTNCVTCFTRTSGSNSALFTNNSTCRRNKFCFCKLICNLLSCSSSTKCWLFGLLSTTSTTLTTSSCK